jgi:predicted nucleotidyltransferase
MIDRYEASEYIEAWQKESVFEAGGGYFKGKPTLHDIDLVVREENVPGVVKAVKSYIPSVPVELYIADGNNYPGLLRAIRASTYEAISQRLMKGLHFRKMRI